MTLDFVLCHIKLKSEKIQFAQSSDSTIESYVSTQINNFVEMKTKWQHFTNILALPDKMDFIGQKIELPVHEH